MLEELAESDAQGELASIYAQIRELTALPYVSSLQRHLATRPGWLEWSWDAVGPLFKSGVAQSTAWNIANGIPVGRLPRLSVGDCRALGLQDADIQSIRELADSFVRVSPTNLVFSGIMLQFLDGRQPGGGNPQTPQDFALPPKIQTLPSLIDFTALDSHQQTVLLRFGTEVNGKPFIPGLYRMLAHWPVYLEALEKHITPLFSDDATAATCQSLAAGIDEAIPELFALVTTPQRDKPIDFATEGEAVRAAIMRYRETSPQMVVFGTLIRDMMPSDSS